MTLPPGACTLRLACAHETPRTWPCSRVTSRTAYQPPYWEAPFPWLALPEQVAPCGSPRGKDIGRPGSQRPSGLQGRDYLGSEADLSPDCRGSSYTAAALLPPRNRRPACVAFHG